MEARILSGIQDILAMTMMDSRWASMGIRPQALTTLFGGLNTYMQVGIRNRGIAPRGAMPCRRGLSILGGC